MSAWEADACIELIDESGVRTLSLSSRLVRMAGQYLDTLDSDLCDWDRFLFFSALLMPNWELAESVQREKYGFYYWIKYSSIWFFLSDIG